MSREDGFLARWSRRKLDTKAPASVNLEPVPPEVAELPAAQVEGEQELSPEELAQLPDIEDLTPNSDVGPFLRKGVPALLRKAALRRIWELDPAIRDYVGDARDYAYDWNVIGGVPGTGPLLPTDDVGATLARMFGREPAAEPEREGGPEPGSAPPAPEGSVQPKGHEAHASPEEDGPERAALSSPVQDESPAVAIPTPAPKPGPARRHGGAVPV